MSRRVLTVFALIFIFSLFITVPSWASLEWRRVTNPEKLSGEEDGIIPGGNRNNSYAWCMEVLPTPEGDYLYVGSNRNLGFFIIGGNRYFSDTMIEEYFDNDLPTGKDFRSRIFRYKLDGSEQWEEVYVSPVVYSGDIGSAPNIPEKQIEFFGGEETQVILGKETGYRGMHLFTPEGKDNTNLYVVSFNVLGTYSRILEISGNATSSEPVEVLRLEVKTLRGIAEHRGKLYAGAEEIYQTSIPSSQPDGMGTSTEGWIPVATSDDLNGTAVWDLLSYKGYLYSFNSQLENMDSEGFSVYKGYFAGKDHPQANEAGWVWETIVGEEGIYPCSVGHIKPNAASPFLFDEMVYVGTQASMPEALMGLVADASDPQVSVQEAFQNFRSLLDPPQIYRFDENDNWELIIGDSSENLDLYGNRIFHDRLGNYGGGFFNPGPLQILAGDSENYSFLQYIWRMEPYGGKLYCTTFDIRVFLRYLTNFISDADQLSQVEDLLSKIDLYNADPAGSNIYSSKDGLTWVPEMNNGFGDPYNYGGRTIKATDQGLFVGTANPFWGAQVWLGNETEETEEEGDTEEHDRIENSGSSGGCDLSISGQSILLILPLLLVSLKRSK